MWTTRDEARGSGRLNRPRRALALALAAATLAAGLPTASVLANESSPPVDAGRAADHFCSSDDPADAALDHVANPRLDVTEGCRLWTSHPPTEGAAKVAIAGIPGDRDALVVHGGDPGGVARRDDRTGRAVWNRTLALHGTVGLEVAPGLGLAFVGARDRVVALDLASGRLAWTSDATDARGAAGLGLDPDGATLYAARTTAGERVRGWDGVWDDPAAIVVEALDVDTGQRRWQNRTDLWWHLQAPPHWDGYGHPTCERGPAEVAVSPDGVVYAARAQTCRYVGVSVVGFAPDGELAYVETHPAPGEDTRWDVGDDRVEGTGLELHPNGRILYATGAVVGHNAHVRPGGIAALDVVSGERLWSWSSLAAESFGAGEEGPAPYCLDPGGTCRVDGGFHDLAVTARGEVLAAGVSAGNQRGLSPYRLRVVALDGITGEPLGRSTLVDRALRPQAGEAASPVLDGWRPDVELALGPDDLTVYAAFRTDEGNRLLGTPLFGSAGETRWHAPGPTGGGNRWALDLAVGERVLVVAGLVGEQGAGGDRPTPVTQGVSRGLAHRALASVQADAIDAPVPSNRTREPSRAVTGLVHGERVTEGTRMVEVNATDRTHAELVIERPGEYYLLVRGVAAFANYTLQGLPLDGGGPLSVTPSSCDGSAGGECVGWTGDCLEGGTGPTHEGPCRPGGTPDPRAWCGAGPDGLGSDPTRRLPLCQQEGKGVCASAVTGLRRHHNWGRKCWGTGREDPVTLARADAPAGGEDGEDAGSVLFGPVVLTEGRYAVLHPRNLTSDAADLTRRCAGSVADADDRLDDRLAACVDVRVRPGADVASGPGLGTAGPSSEGPAGSVGPARGPGQDRRPVAGQLASDTGGASRGEGDRADGCRSDWYAQSVRVPSFTRSWWTGRDDREAMFQTRVLHHVFLMREGPTRHGCVVQDLRFETAVVEFDVVGATDVTGMREWVSRVGARGACELESVRACLEGRAGSALLLHEPAVSVPDKVDGRGELRAEHEVQAGRSDVDEARSALVESLLATAMDAVKSGVGSLVDIVVHGLRLDRALSPVDEDPFSGANHTGYECGLGCQSWNLYVGREPVNLVHRSLHRPCRGTDGERIPFPLKTGVKHVSYVGWLPDEHGELKRESWVFATEPTETRVPVRVHDGAC